jgi:hypothetical protein
MECHHRIIFLLIASLPDTSAKVPGKGGIYLILLTLLQALDVIEDLLGGEVPQPAADSHVHTTFQRSAQSAHHILHGLQHRLNLYEVSQCSPFSSYFKSPKQEEGMVEGGGGIGQSSYQTGPVSQLWCFDPQFSPSCAESGS